MKKGDVVCCIWYEDSCANVKLSGEAGGQGGLLPYHVIIDTDISCFVSPLPMSAPRLDNSNLVGLWRSWRKIMTTFNSVRHSQRVIIIIQVNFGNRKIHWILGYYFPIRFEFNWVNKLIINYFNPHHHHQSQNILLFFKGHQLLFWN